MPSCSRDEVCIDALASELLGSFGGSEGTAAQSDFIADVFAQREGGEPDGLTDLAAFMSTTGGIEVLACLAEGRTTAHQVEVLGEMTPPSRGV